MKFIEFMGPSLAVILCFSIGLMSPVVSYGDTRSEANNVIQLSHEGAQDLAKALFSHYLFLGFTDMFQQNQMLVDLSRSAVIMQAVLKEKSTDLTDLEIGVEDIIALAKDDWRAKSEIQEKVIQLMSARRAMGQTLQNFRYSSNSAQFVAEKGVQLVSQILKHVRSACETGVESQFYIPAIPLVTIRPPEFFVGFQLKMSLEGKGTDSGLSVEYSPMPDPTISDLFGDGDDAGDYAAAVGVVATALIAVALAGGATAYAGLVWYMQAAYFGLAALIVAVIVFIISIFQDIEYRKKAKDQVRAVEDSVYHRANAKDVARYFRQLCKDHGAPLFELERQLQNGLAVTPATNEEREYIGQFTKDYSEVLQKVMAEFERLKEEGKTPEEAREDLEDFPASKELQTLVKERMPLPKLIQSMRAQLATVVSQSQQAELEIEKLIVNQYTDTESYYRKMQKRLDWLERRILEMYGASYSHSLNRDFPDLFDTMKAEYFEREDASQLTIRWYQFLSDYVSLRELFEKSNRTVEEKEQFNNQLFRLQTLRTDMEFFLIMYPQNEAVQLLLDFAVEILERHSYE